MFFLWPTASRLFWWGSLIFLNIGCRDVCLLSCVMEPDGTQLVALKEPKNNNLEKLNSNVSLKESWPGQQIIHLLCCGMFHVGTIFFLLTPPVRSNANVTVNKQDANNVYTLCRQKHTPNQSRWITSTMSKELCNDDMYFWFLGEQFSTGRGSRGANITHTHPEVTLPVRCLQVALHRLEECAWRVRSRGGAWCCGRRPTHLRCWRCVCSLCAVEERILTNGGKKNTTGIII